MKEFVRNSYDGMLKSREVTNAEVRSALVFVFIGAVVFCCIKAWSDSKLVIWSLRYLAVVLIVMGVFILLCCDRFKKYGCVRKFWAGVLLLSLSPILIIARGKDDRILLYGKYWFLIVVIPLIIIIVMMFLLLGFIPFWDAIESTSINTVTFFFLVAIGGTKILIKYVVLEFYNRVATKYSYIKYCIITHFRLIVNLGNGEPSMTDKEKESLKHTVDAIYFSYYFWLLLTIHILVSREDYDLLVLESMRSAFIVSIAYESFRGAWRKVDL